MYSAHRLGVDGQELQFLRSMAQGLVKYLRVVRHDDFVVGGDLCEEFAVLQK